MKTMTKMNLTMKTKQGKLLMISFNKKNKKSICLYENNKKKSVSKLPTTILEELCLKNGSSFNGREESFRYLTGAKQKPGVLISERTQDLYFPTTSKDNPQCVWILYNRIFRVNRYQEIKTKVLFTDGTSTILPLDIRVVLNQIKRRELFLEKINSIE